jgi:hypothetical protein
MDVLDLDNLHDPSSVDSGLRTNKARNVQADTRQLPKKKLQPDSIGFREWRCVDRIDVVSRVVQVAATEQHHIRTGLMAGIPIGRIDKVPRSPRVNQEI